MLFGFKTRIVAISAMAIAIAGCGHTIDTKNLSPQAAAGAKFVAANCEGCHSVNGVDGQGPTFKGLAGSQVKLSDGSTVTADDTYLTQSILDPDSQIVAGYHQGVMTAAFPKGTLKAAQAQQIVAYLDTLK